MQVSEVAEQIQVRTFGGLTIYYGGSPITVMWESQKARLLFCYLLITYDQWVHREKIIEALWPGCNLSAGAKNFKTTLSRLRKSFQGARCLNPVLTQGEALRLNHEEIVVDASEFKNNAIAGIKLLTRGETRKAKQHLERALDVYTAEFLPEEPYDLMISSARQELSEYNLSVIKSLEKIYTNDNEVDALEALLSLKRLPFCQPV